jgi:hypothetical protein
VGGRAFSGINKSGFQSLVPTVPGQYAAVPDEGCQRRQLGTERKATRLEVSNRIACPSTPNRARFGGGLVSQGFGVVLTVLDAALGVEAALVGTFGAGAVLAAAVAGAGVAAAPTIAGAVAAAPVVAPAGTLGTVNGIRRRSFPRKPGTKICWCFSLQPMSAGDGRSLATATNGSPNPPR